MSERYLLTLIAAPGLEEPLVDWLLQYEAQYGFVSFRVEGHSSQLEGLTLAEQVAGRRRLIRFQMCVDKKELDFLLERLKLDFRGTGIQYWVGPVIAVGRV
ncbi:MAG: DUF3240 family protein [Methylohalobius sp.]|nr:DUF3240 family protein [Methylohalobius sp.]